MVMNRVIMTFLHYHGYIFRMGRKFYHNVILVLLKHHVLYLLVIDIFVIENIVLVQ